MKRMFLLLLCGAMLMAPINVLGEEKTMMDYEPLHTLAENHGFTLGAALSYDQLKQPEYLDFVARHFGSITATNEMKAYSLLNMSMTKLNKDGMPGMNYYKADKMVQWARDNGLKVRGHVLVWDAYMTDWFFRVDYDSNKPYADQETVRARMASYIDQVITHFEEKFPGTVYCWDVVNEAVGDSAMEYMAGDPRHLRTSRSGATNIFRDLAGDDYVEYAFLCARNTVERLGADIQLYYNDYNTFQTGKRMAITQLIKSINSYAVDENGAYRKLVDGVGMQGYIGGYGTQSGCMNTSDLTMIKAAINAYSDLGVQVQITEMAVRNYKKDRAPEHAAFYGKLFKTFKSLNADGNVKLNNVSIWGMTDRPNEPVNSYTYRMNGPFGGLITENYAVKPAFDAVYQELLLP